MIFHDLTFLHSENRYVLDSYHKVNFEFVGIHLILPKRWIDNKDSISYSFYWLLCFKDKPLFFTLMILLSNLLFNHFTVHNLSHKVDSMANFPHPRLTISKLNFCLRACQLMIFYSFERPHNESIVFLKSHLKK